MEKPENFGIYIISYKRPDTIMTHKLLEYYKVVIRESEFDEYAKTVHPENLLPVPDEEINSVVKVMNWVIDNAEEDCICILDDDCPCFYYRLEKSEAIYDPEIITSEIERIGQLMIDLDIGWGCDDATNVPWGYDAEFTFKGTTGGIRWINRKKLKARFRQDIGYCCDTDVVMQELLVNRIILKPKYLCPGGGADKNKGGNSKKSRESMIASFEIMKSKWGKYFDYDLNTNKIYVRVPR
jgi:hypothetical protein